MERKERGWKTLVTAKEIKEVMLIKVLGSAASGPNPVN